jgi:hypothetical protein
MLSLSKLYEVMETLRKEGLPVDEKLEQKANEIEEKIIKEDIIPILSKSIEPALQPVKRELVLVVDYIPGQSLGVHLSRKRNFTANMPDAKEIVMDPEVQHGSHEIHSEGKIQRGQASKMVVEFPDGTTFAEDCVADTYEKAIRKIGVMDVRKVVEDYKLKVDKVPVISNHRDAKYGKSQRDLGDGWLLITHCCSEKKKKVIEKISAVLNLGIKVTLKA